MPPGRGRRDGGQPAVDSYVQPPDTLEAFPNAERVPPKTGYGGGKLRRRWKDSDSGRLYEWDYLHGRVEVYDKRGKHLYEADAKTGAQTGPPNPEYTIEP